MKAGAIKKVDAHVFERQAEEHYVEMRWNDRVLFENEHFFGTIHDPCCGWGRVPEEAAKRGHDVSYSDVVDRGFPGVVIEDFLRTPTRRKNIVFNPPFNIGKECIRHACNVTARKVAAIWPVKRLNASHWMRELRLERVWFLTPRPSMPPGIVTEELMISLGKDPSGGTVDFCWVVFNNSDDRVDEPRYGWLHRDRGEI